MKKIIAILFISLLILSGCGGGKNSSDPPVKQTGYTYKWSTGATSITASIKAFSLGSIAYADDTDTSSLIGSAIPPYGGVSIIDNSFQNGPAIYTYYNGEAVDSTFTYDPLIGTVGPIAPNNPTIAYLPIKAGVQTITAHYNDETLDIQVRVYHWFSIDLNQSIDFDNDKTNDFNFVVGGINAPYGYQILDNQFLSDISTAPTSGYHTDQLSSFSFNKVYIVETSGGKYAKLLLVGSVSSASNFDFLVSNNQGEFEY
jgi:hypothetical protein